MRHVLPPVPQIPTKPPHPYKHEAIQTKRTVSSGCFGEDVGDEIGGSQEGTATYENHGGLHSRRMQKPALQGVTLLLLQVLHQLCCGDHQSTLVSWVLQVPKDSLSSQKRQ